MFTVLCLVVCGVGIAHTRGTNLEGRFPYFAFAAILGGMVGDYNVIKQFFDNVKLIYVNVVVSRCVYILSKINK